MKNSSQPKLFTDELDEHKTFNLHSFVVASLVQIWQMLSYAYTAYVRVVWLKQRQRTRLHLLDLTDDQLKDIGISRAEAKQEGNKFFWE
ncbi:DUF1127 domain-containing protein [uncultured Thiothrix sp.]|uniref:DUF1127 domain-containing protein n=1 Tax=uncultured Thiothrix sp. TaxID=223185 RepID=UPI00262EC6F1|nr:DUF1127 domain-containing protein [uncultured Thiothrix sp.]